MNYEKIAEDVMQQDCMRPEWAARDLAIWLREGCRCAYCGKDMLESYDTVHYGSPYDHLLPKTEYPELEDVDWNRVLSCRACNTIKNIFDPNKSTPLYIKGAQGIAESDRFELIDRAQRFIDSQRPSKEKFRQQRDLILKALRSIRSSSAVAAGATN